MLNFILGVLLALLAVIFWTISKTYQYIPQRELKRLARSGDEVAQLLYRAVAYGLSLQVLLNTLAVICGAVALATFVPAIGVWLSILLLGALLLVGWLVLVPGGELTHGGIWLTKRMTPGIAWLLERLHPSINAAVHFVRRHRHVYVHTGLYEKDDLVELLEQQKGQPDSRIPEDEIDLLQHALMFGDKLVSDALVPQRAVAMVATSDAVGPVLMDELNKSGHSRFPVFEGKPDNIVGILYLHDLVGVKHSGTVADVMNRKLTYVHENFTLYQSLQAFLKTKQHLFLVVNSFEELVGILSLEDVLEQIIGQPIMDEFDRYDDLRLVAAAAARKEHAEHTKDETEPEGSTPEVEEMVE
jgi:CBS domain containing-hemolysin-like protein